MWYSPYISKNRETRLSPPGVHLVVCKVEDRLDH